MSGLCASHVRSLVGKLSFRSDTHRRFHKCPQALLLEGAKGSVTAKWVGHLGNLIFVDGETNNKLANKDFAAKLRVLEKTSVYLDEKIKKCTTWSDKEIEERTKALAKLAYDNVWKL